MELFRSPSKPGQRFSLAVHAGAGKRRPALDADQEASAKAGLERALLAGQAILEQNGSALDAVCAAVRVLEDEPSFNAGHGAALTETGIAELDAAVMTGDSKAGAVAGSRFARNPVDAARAVLEQTRHTLIIAPSAELDDSWGVATVSPDYFVTDRRIAELAAARQGLAEGTKHGTVGAVARDSHGHTAAATSTGGITGQMEGRIGDSPVIGAGTYANDATVAISCTGDGEKFIQGVVAYDVSAQVEYLGTELGDAVESTFARRLDPVGGSGGLIAVGATGDVVLGFNSGAMFRGWIADGCVNTAI